LFVKFYKTKYLYTYKYNYYIIYLEGEIQLNNTTQKIRTWLHSKGNILKIVSNPKKGMIKIYNENGKILMKKTNLTKEQIKTIEESFIGFIFKKLNDMNVKQKKEEKYDPMIT